MKKILTLICFLILLSGCDRKDNSMENALAFRSKLNDSGCHFDARITADYGNAVYTFRLQCSYQAQGEMIFSVLEPELIAGITGNVSPGGGKLTFDEMALSFPLLADGQLSPVSAPWVMMKSLHSGYLIASGADGDYTRVTLRDSYEDNAMTVDVWLDESDTPVRAEILWENRRILTILVEDFAFE